MILGLLDTHVLIVRFLAQGLRLRCEERGNEDILGSSVLDLVGLCFGCRKGRGGLAGHDGWM